MDNLTVNANSFLISPQSFNDAMEIAKTLANSDFVPSHFKGKPAELVLVMEWASILKIHFLQLLPYTKVVNGQMGIWGDLMLALVKRDPCFEYIDEQVTDTGATCIVKRKNQPPQTRPYSMQDAIRAKLTNKKNWQENPKRMMQMRARTYALRDVFPDILNGLHSTEELEDYRVEEKDITPKPEVYSATCDEQITFKSKSDEIAHLLAVNTTSSEKEIIEMIESDYENRKDVLIEKITEITANNEKANLALEKWISMAKVKDSSINKLEDLKVDQLQLSLSKLTEIYVNIAE